LSKFNQVMFLHTSIEEFRQWATRPTPKDSQQPDAVSLVTHKEGENESPAKVEEKPEALEHNSCKHVQAMIDWYVFEFNRHTYSTFFFFFSLSSLYPFFLDLSFLVIC